MDGSLLFAVQNVGSWPHLCRAGRLPTCPLSVAKLPRQPLTDAAIMTQRWGNRLAATAAR